MCFLCRIIEENPNDEVLVLAGMAAVGLDNLIDVIDEVLKKNPEIFNDSQLNRILAAEKLLRNDFEAAKSPKEKLQ